MKRSQASALVFAAAVFLTGCQNNNLFSGLHKEGSGDAASLVADGQTAIAVGDFAAALDYFNRALAQDPKNSEALYGAAVAEMGLSGIDIGQLITNALAQNSSFAPSLHRAYVGHAAPGAIHVTNNSLLEGIDIQKLDNALGSVIPNLETIRMGLADGAIAPDDTNLLINLGLVRLLRAASHSIRKAEIDILVNGDHYDIVDLPGVDCAVVDNAAKNVAWGYKYLGQASLGLNQGSGDMIFDLKDDINVVYPDIATFTGCPEPPSANAMPAAVSPTDGLNP